MLRHGSTVIGVSDLPRAMAFYMAALGYQPRYPVEDGWVILDPPGRVGSAISLDVSESPLQEMPRIHLDLYADDQAAEVERLLGFGATRVDWPHYPPDADFVVLADTEGNVFCVIDASAG